MNNSGPGSAALTTTSTPLSFALSLFTGLETRRPNITVFTSQLTAIHHAAYLLLLPRATPAEADFQKAETTRIANGPLSNMVLHISSMFFLLSFRTGFGDDGSRAHRQAEDIYDATDRMLIDLAAEQSRHMDNMALLLSDMKAKWKTDLEKTGSWHNVARTLGPSGIASAQALSDLVADRPKPPPHRRSKTYLSDMARHWRTWGGRDASGPYEEVWTYVAGRALRMD